ncbi:alpha-L-rhamnosidase [uncultured Proteiniphilum sp.]|uniref:alpha-L-rhamnosidase n=1 Tax=uncultured Proteiniphilum sp. TaxID=497637 RepID=UPI0026034895|nr:alpha-L-rhamnosidase [uncultured Proteiniphilum sp.]
MKSSRDIVVDTLQCRNLTNPEGIDFPLLSWEISTSEEGVFQTAWEIEIASRENLLRKGKADVWKSGKQLSGEQFNIKPELPLKEATPYYWRVRIWDNSGSVSGWSDPAYFSTGLLSEASWDAQWITYPRSEKQALPYFRKEFSLDRGVPVKALAYFCGLGAGELYLNGKQVDSTRFLDPAQTDYEQYALYSTLDVTEYLQKENNCLGVMLGNGWFSQKEAWGGAPFSYGDPMFRVQLIMFFDDDSRVVLRSDETWAWQEGPVSKTNIYLGESYDARREVTAWSEPGISPDGWQPAIPASKNIPPCLIPQLTDPIRKKEVLSAKKIWKDPSGNWIYDFGGNVAGIPLLEIQQPEGAHLTIRFSEEIDTDGSLNFASTGWIHHGDIFKDEYICKGSPVERWSPRFTYHGYRYAELSGISGEPDETTLKLVVVHTDIENSGSFECADEQINKLHEMAVRTVKNNLHGIPTDCPIREKCGWLGDVHAYVKMANLNFRMDNFWQKYLGDIRSGASKEEKNTLFHERYNNTFYFDDKPSGIPYMIAPGKRLCGVASPDWGTVIVQLPWWMYVYNGNKAVLEEYYPMMKQWTEYVGSLAKNEERTKKYSSETTSIVYQGLGDWCPPAYKSADNTPVEFTSTAFHYLDTHIMEQVASLLGKEEDAKTFASMKEEIAREIVAILYNPVEKTFGTQTADAMALDLGLVPAGDEKAVADAIVRNMNERSEGFMHTGIFGIGRLGSMLARNGNVQAAWNMFTKKGENSFEWMWKSANATSLWETLPVNEISRKSAAVASHNHPMQAGYDVAFFEDIAGIRPDPTGYGFKTIRFEPLFCDYLPWAKATIHTPYGEVTSSWKNEDNRFDWEISIPPNSTGLVTIPFEGEFTVNGKTWDDHQFPRVESPAGVASYTFPSGRFHITN